MAQWVFESLSKAHDRKSFSCGVPSLDDYLKKQASQDQKRSLAFCYVLTEEGSGEIAGYYTLSAASVPLNNLPEELKKKLRYDQIPAALIGRLAVSQAHQGKGFGKLLLMNAFDRLMKADLAMLLVLVDPKDATAVRFYRRFGFDTLAGDPSRMFLTMATLSKLKIELYPELLEI